MFCRMRKKLICFSAPEMAVHQNSERKNLFSFLLDSTRVETQLATENKNFPSIENNNRNNFSIKLENENFRWRT